MKEQFTQGEWLTDRNNAHSKEIATVWHCLDNDWVEIWAPEATGDEVEQEANAQLMKVAPKMFRELERQRKGLVNLIDMELIPASHVDGAMIEIMGIDKILAEARGEKPDSG